MLSNCSGSTGICAARRRLLLRDLHLLTVTCRVGGTVYMRAAGLLVVAVVVAATSVALGISSSLALFPLEHEGSQYRTNGAFTDVVGTVRIDRT